MLAYSKTILSGHNNLNKLFYWTKKEIPNQIKLLPSTPVYTILHTYINFITNGVTLAHNIQFMCSNKSQFCLFFTNVQCAHHTVAYSIQYTPLFMIGILQWLFSVCFYFSPFFLLKFFFHKYCIMHVVVNMCCHFMKFEQTWIETKHWIVFLLY